MTADEALRIVSYADQDITAKGDENPHASHAENPDDGIFCLALHMEFPHEEYWQDSNSKVTQRSEYAVDIGHGNDNVDANAVALNRRVKCQASPEIAERLAL